MKSLPLFAEKCVEERPKYLIDGELNYKSNYVVKLIREGFNKEKIKKTM